MKKLKGRWRLYANFILLSAILITSFQNCSHIEASQNSPKIPSGVEVVLEQ
jgi:hypothetical protein